jgi:uncharacterized protein (TIGR02246 family)
MAAPKKSSSRQEIRRALSSKSKTELLNLIRDLYALTPENRDFVNARILTSEETLEPCKATVGASFDRAVMERRAVMRQLSKVRKSRNQWKHKAIQRADDNRYLCRELTRIKQERDRHKQVLKATQVRLRHPDAYPDDRLLYLMIVDPSQLQSVREREAAKITVIMQVWEQAFRAESPENILSLYAEDAVLWGALSPLRRDTPTAIRDYFTEVFTLMERKVTFIDPLIRVYGDTAVNTGYYTFSWIRDEKSETIPARYSITYVKRYQQWLIVEHHSSVKPELNLKPVLIKKPMLSAQEPDIIK